MAKREVLGRMVCPDCGFNEAEIKVQKCGVKLYRHCPECNAQFFARNEGQSAVMRRLIGASTEPAPKAEAPTVTVTEKKPAAPTVAATKVPPKKINPLAFLMGQK